jgi:hypothetical protein
LKTSGDTNTWKSDLAYANTVLVLIVDPDTATAGLQLAVALAHPEDGSVSALIVSTGDAEAESGYVKAIEPTVAAMNEEAGHVKLARY